MKKLTSNNVREKADMEALLGVDIGTTGCKVILVNRDGRILDKSFQPYPLYTPELNFAEQNPTDWWEAFKTSVKKVMKKASAGNIIIRGIGLSGQMHGLVLLDGESNILRPAILWCDHRTESESRFITKKIGAKRLLQITGNPAFASFTASKIIWVREHEPHIYQKIYKMLLPKDYVRYRLTGIYGTEPSDASGTNLFDIRQKTWSGKILDELGIPREWVPDCYESTQTVGGLRKDVASELGLSEDVSVIGGAADQPAQATGIGAITPGIISCTIGTSGVVAATSSHPTDNCFCHTLPERWLVLLAMHSAGASLRWYQDTFTSQETKYRKTDPYDPLVQEASQIEVGSEGLIFLPFLLGERTASGYSRVKGTFAGITAKHDRRHFTRAILEGVCYEFRRMMEMIKKQGVTIKQVILSGGGAKSKYWRQMFADVLQTEMAIVDNEDAAAYGAFLLTATGLRYYASLEEACDRTVRIKEKVLPDKNKSKVYSQFYLQYKDLYAKLSTPQKDGP